MKKVFNSRDELMAILRELGKGNLIVEMDISSLEKDVFGMVINDDRGFNIIFTPPGQNAASDSEEPNSDQLLKLLMGGLLSRVMPDRPSKLNMDLLRYNHAISMMREHLGNLKRCKAQRDLPDAIVFTGGDSNNCATLFGNGSQPWLSKKRKARILDLFKNYFPQHFNNVDVPIITLSIDPDKNLWAFNEIFSPDFDRSKSPCMEETLSIAVKNMGDPEDVKILLPDYIIICNGSFIPFGNGFGIDPKWDGFIAETLLSNLSNASLKGTFGVHVMHFGPNMILMLEQFRPVFCPDCPGCGNVCDWIGQSQNLDAMSYLQKVSKLAHPNS